MKHLIIHGHFYQPPRENPWLSVIEKQDGANPYHDFNEKIAAECYTPNGFSKYLDGYGRILDIVNNYEYLSFNFGATLINWIKENIPLTYRKIIEGDKASLKRYNGHGNAIAQVYNHIILPLASVEDIYTQINWGISDFERHFERKPEGMWLSETAINMQTVRALIDCNIKFTVLSPFQAEKIKLMNQKNAQWNDVSDGSVSPGQAYRIYDYDDKGKKIDNRYIDVFFFDRVLAPAVSFEHLLRDADVFLNRLIQASKGFEESGALVNIATDGETFGHHEPFANMCITAMIKKLKQNELSFINYGYYLEKYPPKYEVVLKKGDYGTAWSCSHGVGRWYRNCGCSTDSPSHWNQEWRRPLRDGFNFLKTELDNIYFNEVKKYFENPWDLRNKYIDVINGVIGRDEFVSKITDEVDKKKILILLEIQKYGMYMFTSCGWFFGDISRIEPVHNMKYAIKALDLLSIIDEDKAKDLEDRVRIILSSAKSNIKEYDDGRWIWDNFAKSAKVVDEHFANHFAIKSAVTRSYESCRLFGKNISLINQPVTEEEENRILYSMELEVYDTLIDYKKTFKVNMVNNNFDSINTEISIKNGSENKISEPVKFGLNDLFYDEKGLIIKAFLKDRVTNLSKYYARIYEENIELINFISELGMPLPPELSWASVFVLSEIITLETENYLSNADSNTLEKIKEARKTAQKYKITIDNSRQKKMIDKKLIILTDSLKKNPSIEIVEEIIKVVEFSIECEVYLNSDYEKNVVFEMLSGFVEEKNRLSALNNLKDMNFDIIFKVIKLAELLNLNVDIFRDRLNPFK
jgi:hypothetical protein